MTKLDHLQSDNSNPLDCGNTKTIDAEEKSGRARSMLRRATLGAILLCVAGCVTNDPVAFRQAMIQNLPVDYKAKILEQMGKNYGDPKRFRNVMISESVIGTNIFGSQRSIVCVTLLLKDRIFGGEMFEATDYEFQSGKLSSFNPRAKAVCRQAERFRPFPEAEHIVPVADQS